MGRLTLKLLKIEPPFIDRREWQLGKAWVNVLMLSVGYKNISIPLFRAVLEEIGCSDNAERSTSCSSLFSGCRIDNIWLSDQFFLHYRDDGVVILSKQKNLCFYEDFLLFATRGLASLCIWLNKRIKRISATFSS
jgi:hypothetical protein